jgi:hypothetical protein
MLGTTSQGELSKSSRLLADIVFFPAGTGLAIPPLRTKKVFVPRDRKARHLQPDIEARRSPQEEQETNN